MLICAAFNIAVLRLRYTAGGTDGGRLGPERFGYHRVTQE